MNRHDPRKWVNFQSAPTLLECQKSDKRYLLDLWREVGWDGDTPVWRLEFEFRREVLAQLDLNTVPAVLGNLSGLWSYASTDWLRLCMPNPDDKTRSRWDVHPLWLALAAIDWETQGGPLLRTFRPTRAPSRDYIGQRVLAHLASIAALVGVSSFDDAYPELLNAASTALGRRYGASGISTEQGFAEMVEARRRAYNLGMNEPEEDAPMQQPLLQNPYYRKQQGMS